MESDSGKVEVESDGGSSCIEIGEEAESGGNRC